MPQTDTLRLLAQCQSVSFPLPQDSRRRNPALAQIKENLENNIRFCALNLKGMNQEGPLFYALCKTQKEAIEALRLVQGELRGKRLKNFNDDEILERRYVTFTGSVQEIFELLDPELAGRVPAYL